MLELHTVGHQILDASNKPFPFRGIGRLGDMEYLGGIWAKQGEHPYNTGYQWLRNGSLTLAQQGDIMDINFDCWRDVWKTNTLRVFVPVEWWWKDQINCNLYPYGPNLVISERDYFEVLAQRALAKGFYINFCPFDLRCYFSGIGSNISSGFPGNLTTAGRTWLTQNIHTDEMQAWRLWWTSVVERLGKYPNVIWEMWNEPNDGNSDNTAMRTNWFNYCVEMYKTIRNLGNQNLIFTQWQMNAVPGYKEQLTWIPVIHNMLRNAIGGEPVNQVYTTHGYRYSWNRAWKLTESEILAQMNMSSMVPQSRSNGIDVPLVDNECGCGLDLSGQALTDELNWFRALIRVSNSLDIGFMTLFWANYGWAPVENLIQAGQIWSIGASSPPPSSYGQIYIDNAPDITPTVPLTIDAVNEDTDQSIAVPLTVDGVAVGTTPGPVYVTPGPHTISVPPEVDV